MMKLDGRCSRAPARHAQCGESWPVTLVGSSFSRGSMNETLEVVGADGRTLSDAVATLSKKAKFDVEELTWNVKIAKHIAVIGILHLLPGARECQPCDPHDVCSLPSWCTRAGGLFPRFGGAMTTAVVDDQTDIVTGCNITSAATLVFTLSLSSSSPLSKLPGLSSGEGYPKPLDNIGSKDDKEEDKRSIKLGIAGV